ncbi:MAG TPA: IclR family transcriptional regulator [Bellilinea sp.]|nr:IclR family transcriptional regulator [Bellilinea sp.]
MQKADSDSRTLNRFCDILNCFSKETSVLTLTEISRCVGLPKSTTFRFIEALQSQGILNADPHSHGYRLGYQLISWGSLAQDSIDIRNDAAPFLNELTEKTGETSVLSMRFGNVGTWIEIIESRQPVRLNPKVGQSLQLHAGASSKVLIAFLPDKLLNEILSGMRFEKYGKNSITDVEEFKKELQLIRNQGYATSFEETDIGAMGIAAPVYNHLHEVIAGIGIVAPMLRIPPEK